MNNTYTNSLFESIKGSLAGKKPNSTFQDFLKLNKGSQYIVRFIPNIESPERTMFHYYSHMWDSVIGGKVSILCPYTFGERCPIDEYRAKIYRTEDPDKIASIKPLSRSENWLYNVYVVSDPTNPENEGKVKILRVGRQLQKKIQDAISGDDAEEFGARVFDLTENGVNFKIKVEENEGGYASYVNSRFTSPCKLANVQDVNDIYTEFKPLDTIFEHKSYDVIKNLLDVHFFGKEEQFTSEEPSTEPATEKVKVQEDNTNAQEERSKDVKASDESDDNTNAQEARMKELLADFE